ncbi:hypothetical protein BDQ17DRAFT_1439121 [Cyathus striatus]|nr:hypothetical protein BDQ17DRAFT_1439121 [Cyathus striatus]
MPPTPSPENAVEQCRQYYQSLYDNMTQMICGTVLSSMAYGVVFLLFIGCSHHLRKRALSSKPRTIGELYLLLYTTVMFVLSTITLASQAEATVRRLSYTPCPSTLDISDAAPQLLLINPRLLAGDWLLGKAGAYTFVIARWALTAYWYIRTSKSPSRVSDLVSV